MRFVALSILTLYRVPELLRDASLTIRPHFSDRVNERFGCGKLCCWNDEHGVFKDGLDSWNGVNSMRDYDPDPVCAVSNLRLPASCCIHVIIKNV